MSNGLLLGPVKLHEVLKVEDGEIKSRIDVKQVFDEIFTADFEQSRFERRIRQTERVIKKDPDDAA